MLYYLCMNGCDIFNFPFIVFPKYVFGNLNLGRKEFSSTASHIVYLSSPIPAFTDFMISNNGILVINGLFIYRFLH